MAVKGLVRNPEDKFSRNEAQKCLRMCLSSLGKCNDTGSVRGRFPMEPLVILPLEALVANGTVDLPMVPLGEPVVQLALPLVPMV